MAASCCYGGRASSIERADEKEQTLGCHDVQSRSRFRSSLPQLIEQMPPSGVVEGTATHAHSLGIQVSNISRVKRFICKPLLEDIWTEVTTHATSCPATYAPLGLQDISLDYGVPKFASHPGRSEPTKQPVRSWLQQSSLVSQLIEWSFFL
ncbi:hypothetical protein M758_9G132300 [Ceratodon purpureus]|nr:hypothetical protein M758_9G132300 [Ceratodon purpureus]